MNLIEVERKRELTDPETLRARLTTAGYREGGTRVEVDTYYSRPDRDFLRTVECLRVRRRDGDAEITYKPASTAETHSADDIIAKRETNVSLAGPGQTSATLDLLDTLGMVRLCQVDKTRITYRDPGDTVTVVVDTFAGLGAFAETEVLAEDSSARGATPRPGRTATRSRHAARGPPALPRPRTPTRAGMRRPEINPATGARPRNPAVPMRPDPESRSLHPTSRPIQSFANSPVDPWPTVMLPGLRTFHCP
ncbi:class IV adenylate cyclase [Saccharomonospora halophila]|uniref:class IV adenylate cyclase n=1 Tax=Saccharomonospora halophila TaxID=129922 RepID=UPI0003A80D9C|nr:class IV adenylate cyclase [Saccharomonospora halophila]